MITQRWESLDVSFWVEEEEGMWRLERVFFLWKTAGADSRIDQLKDRWVGVAVGRGGGGTPSGTLDDGHLVLLIRYGVLKKLVHEGLQVLASWVIFLLLGFYVWRWKLNVLYVTSGNFHCSFLMQWHESLFFFFFLVCAHVRGDWEAWKQHFEAQPVNCRQVAALKAAGEEWILSFRRNALFSGQVPLNRLTPLNSIWMLLGRDLLWERGRVSMEGQRWMQDRRAEVSDWLQDCDDRPAVPGHLRPSHFI